MTVTPRLALTLHDTETGQSILDRIDANLAIIETRINTVEPYPSGLPEGTAPGRVVALAPDGQVYFAYDNPPGGQENRQNVVGVTLDRAPAEGEDINVLLLGICKFANAGSLWSQADPDIASFPGQPGDVVPFVDPTHGKIAYLQDGETGDLSTQGYVTADAGNSAGKIVVGMFMPNEFLLVMPVQYIP